MRHQLDQLLSEYESGRLTRRELLGALAMLAAAAPAASAQTGAVGAVKQLNHVTIFVPEVKKSVAFYQTLLNLPVLTRQDPGINLNAGSGFLGIYPTPAGTATGSINHFCFGVENFNADQVLKSLVDRGVKANIRMRGETKELYFTDPDGIRVQLQDVKYKGGVGVLGDQDPK
jgi:catechol 2,3-dioxygenase-like lactoylglutathione lyase family enzyme